MTDYGIDTSTPNVARIYDFLLGGKDNFAADREAGRQLISAIPDAAAIARDNRSFLSRAVRYLAAECGIRQFVDLGGGLPTQANVHQLAQAAAPDARVVYVDHDPVVALHGQALLASRDQVAMVLADLREPSAVLDHPEVRRLIDRSRPVAVLCTSTLHFISDAENPHTIIAEYRDRLAPGSFLAITHASVVPPEEDPDGDVDRATSVYTRASAQLHARPVAEILRFFDGFELVEPGLVWMPEWRPEPGVAPSGRVKSLRACVGRRV
jgi:O-methyltransferase involved in polyketide biosynthesis